MEWSRPDRSATGWSRLFWAIQVSFFVECWTVKAHARCRFTDLACLSSLISAIGGGGESKECIIRCKRIAGGEEFSQK